MIGVNVMEGRESREILTSMPNILMVLAVVLIAASYSLLAGAAEPLSLEDSLKRLDASEADLLAALSEVHEGRLEDGLNRVSNLVERNPEFRLAWLIYGDLLSAKSGRAGVNGIASGAAGIKLEGLQAEAKARIENLRSLPPPGRLPAQLLQMSESQTRALVFDASRYRVYVIERNGDGLSIARNYYTSAGRGGILKTREGDGKTPVGVYFVTSRLDRDTLPDLYGSGAFPVNYPNEWDARLGRTGYGIWLHGVPSNTYSRVPTATFGCLAIPNSNFEALWDEIDVGNTPVIMADRVRWVDPAETRRRRDDFMFAFDQWKIDWQSLDFSRYARHYSSEFRSGGENQKQWLRRKRRINAGKTFIRVAESDMSIFAYPMERDLLVVAFAQDYRSNNYQDSIRKRQYWRQETDGVWRIVYEDEVRFLPIHLRGMPPSARAGLTEGFWLPS